MGGKIDWKSIVAIEKEIHEEYSDPGLIPCSWDQASIIATKYADKIENLYQQYGAWKHVDRNARYKGRLESLLKMTENYEKKLEEQKKADDGLAKTKLLRKERP